MTSKKSAESVLRNKFAWSKNLTSFSKSLRKRQKMFKYIGNPLESLCKLPKVVTIVGRYLALAEGQKSSEIRLKQICEEVTKLWQKMNFPILSSQSVKRKVTNIITKYHMFQKKPTAKSEESFSNLFDVTKPDGIWLCLEDKNLYYAQLQSKGEVGYTTEKLAPKETIHPSKRRKVTDTEQSTSKSCDIEESVSTSSNSESDEAKFSDVSSEFQEKKVYHSTKSARKLVRFGKISSNKAHTVCKILQEDNPQIATPSQSGIYKAAYKEAQKLEESYITDLKNENWSLHFDGKLINKVEHQVVVLKNETKEIRLTVLVLPDAKSLTIAHAIEITLDKFYLWQAIKMIVCDTTATNTGRLNGVVVRLQRKFQDHGVDKPIYIGCQHHILDRILKHVFDQLFGECSTSPDINYPFVTNILQNYEHLRKVYKTEELLNLKEEERREGEVKEENVGWRDDMKFLYQLIKVFKHYKQFNRMMKVRFQALPGLSNARWNSRAIFALLSYILVPESREMLDEGCTFISGHWSKVWFGGQMFDEQNYEDLHQQAEKYPKAAVCLKTHWSTNPSPVNTQRSNICAERAVKVLQDLYPLCHSTRRLNLRFLLSNK